MRHDTFLGRLGTVGMLSMGYQVLHVFALFCLMTIIPMVPAGVKLPPDQQPTTVAISDGQPILWRADYNRGQWDFHSPDGQPIQVSKTQQFSAGAYLYLNDDVTVSSPDSWSSTQLAIGQNNAEPWFFIQERVGRALTGYFIAYSSRTRLPIVYLGATGQTTNVPPVDQRFQLLRGVSAVVTGDGYAISSGFASASSGSVYVLTQTGLEYVDLKARRITRVVTSNDLSSLEASRQQEFVFGHINQKAFSSDIPLLLLDHDTVLQIRQGAILARYTIPDALRNRGFTAFPVDGNTIYYGTSLGEPYAYTNPRDLLQCDAAGKTVKSWRVQQPSLPLVQNLNRDYLFMVAVFPTPLHIAGSLMFGQRYQRMDRVELVRKIWPSFLAALACGLLSVIAVWKLTPGFSGHPVQWGWLVYVFVFGLAGAVGYLLHFRHRRRPHLEPAALLGSEVFA